MNRDEKPSNHPFLNTETGQPLPGVQKDAQGKEPGEFEDINILGRGHHCEPSGGQTQWYEPKDLGDKDDYIS